MKEVSIHSRNPLLKEDLDNCGEVLRHAFGGLRTNIM